MEKMGSVVNVKFSGRPVVSSRSLANVAIGPVNVSQRLTVDSLPFSRSNVQSVLPLVIGYKISI